MAAGREVSAGTPNAYGGVFLTWNFPNRMSWFDEEIIGNYYSTRYTDAWDVIEKLGPSSLRWRQRRLIL